MNPLPANPYTLPTVDFIAGATMDIAFRAYFETNKEPFNLEACTINFAVVNYVNKDGSPVVSKSMEVMAGTDFKNGEPVPNVLFVSLEPSDTINLPAGKYIYQITIKDVSGDVEPPSQGIMRISKNINTAFLQ